MTHGDEAGREPGVAMFSNLADARGFARAPISGFTVGAVARGDSDQWYMGANLEFPGTPLGTSVHAEQAAIATAWAHGASRITALAVSATPCGHCRQFLSELRDAASLPILVEGEATVTLAELLPRAFGPGDLGTPGRLLDPVTHGLRLADDEAAAGPLAAAALEAAGSSYAPYSGTLSGIALELADGSTLTGRAAENAAFNPGLPALQSALVALALRRLPYEAIRRAVLVETAGPAPARAAAEALLAAIAPSVRLSYLPATRTP